MAEDNVELKEPEIQIEVVSEVPEEEKPRLRGGNTSTLDVADDEISGYGRDVQNRIKKLRFAFHEERRMREQAQRESTTAQDFAKRVYQENERLKRNVQLGERAVVHQALTRVDAEISQAKADSKRAYESGQADDIVANNEKLARAVAEKERLALLKDDSTEEQREDRQERPPAQPPQPQQDERTRQWMSRNKWWNQPGEEERTAFALGVDKKLAAQGVTAINNPDLYWRTIDDRLAAVFPEVNGNGNGSSNGHGHDVDLDREEQPQRGSRPQAVVGGTRANTGGATNAGRTRVIRLSESQVRLAQRLGLSAEQYARQLEKEQANG